jgi:hypothetical protein
LLIGTIQSADAQGRGGQGAAVQAEPGKLYNTAKQKLLEWSVQRRLGAGGSRPRPGECVRAESGSIGLCRRDLPSLGVW